MRERGFSVNRLRTLAASFAGGGCNAELAMISDALPEELRTDNEAATLWDSWLFHRFCASKPIYRQFVGESDSV